MEKAPSTQALHPNHSIGRSLATFDLESPSSPRHGSNSNPASPRSSHPPSPRSRTSRSGANTPVEPRTPSSRLQYDFDSTAHGHRLLTPASLNPDLPLIICFRGSGDSCRHSWQPLGRVLSQKYRVLMYERSSGLSPPEATTDLISYLGQNHLPGPYVLVAHSHGGAYARCFLHRIPKADIAGVVLVETGQEGVWDAKIQEDQEDQHVLGERPLVVIKGNSILRKWRQIEEDEADMRERASKGEKVRESEKARLMMMRNEMSRWDKEDMKLKKRQLRLSKKHRFVNLPDVGHHVIRDAPERVAEEVDWVMANLKKGTSACNSAAGSKSNSRNASVSSSRRTSVEGELGKEGIGMSSGNRERSVNGLSSWFRKASLAISSPSKDGREDRRASR